ncbi:MAG: hypothetical protein HYT87_14645 [Nitrospirae bacterium]|nr:hypothetical protein [Nitrospirota bacterium]
MRSVQWPARVLGLLMGAVVTMAATAHALPIQGSAAQTLFSGVGLARVFTDIIRKETLLGTTGDIPGSRPKMEAQVIGLMGAFPVNEDLTLAAAVPYVRTEARDSSGASSEASGIGEAVFLARYSPDVFKRLGPSTRLQFGPAAGVKVPTGADNIGSGSYDFIWDLPFQYIHKKAGIYAGPAGQLNGSNSGVRQGHVVGVNLSAEYLALSSEKARSEFYVMLELNGGVAGRSRHFNQAITDSGGNSLFAAPGIQYFLMDRFTFEISYQLPLWENLNGTQLSQDRKIRAGAYALF